MLVFDPISGSSRVAILLEGCEWWLALLGAQGSAGRKLGWVVVMGRDPFLLPGKSTVKAGCSEQEHLHSCPL